MTVTTVSHPASTPLHGSVLLETPRAFSFVFDILDAQKIDRIMTKMVYDVDWDKHSKRSIEVIAVITRAHANIIGFMPVVGVSRGAFRLSIGVLRLALAAASLGACRMFGVKEAATFCDFASHAYSIKEGVVEIMPLAFGAGMYLSNFTPSIDLLVTDLKVSQDKWGVVSEFCHQTTAAALKADEEKYQDLKPWAAGLTKACEKTYVFATEGAECIVTCAAWGDIALGVGALVASPIAGGSTVPYGLYSIARGALALGASSLLDLAKEWDLQGKITRLIVDGTRDPVAEVEASLFKLIYQLNKDCEQFAIAYEAIEELGLDS
jgi:hypothetical protein